MTPKQILDSFSTTLMQDERILSAQERNLVSSLLQHARTAAGEDPNLHAAVQKVVAAAVGETVAQRTFSILGGSIVESILENGRFSYNEATGTERAGMLLQPQPPGKQPQPPGTSQPQPPGTPQPQPPGVYASSDGPYPTGRQPQPPGKQPQPPGTSQPQPPGAQPQPPGVYASSNGPYPTGRQPQPPGKQPQPPATGQPQPPGAQPQPPGIHTGVVARTAVAVAEPEVLPAQCVVLDEFLAPQELEGLTRFTLEHEADFGASEVVSPTSEKGVINYEHRRSRLLFDVGPHQDVILNRIKSVLPQVLDQLGMEEFPIAGVEVQITASNDGDFFRFHNDNGSDKVASRNLTFVYFFHREPQPFEGGELRIHDARREGETFVSEGSYQTIVPGQNQIVFFPCELMHEVMPVKCPSGLFADSRFTLNGWLRQ